MAPGAGAGDTARTIANRCRRGPRRRRGDRGQRPDDPGVAGQLGLDADPGAGQPVHGVPPPEQPGDQLEPADPVVPAPEVGQPCSEDAAPSFGADRADQLGRDQELGRPRHQSIGEPPPGMTRIAAPDADPIGDPRGLRDQLVGGRHRPPQPTSEPQHPAPLDARHQQGRRHPDADRQPLEPVERHDRGRRGVLGRRDVNVGLRDRYGRVGLGRRSNDRRRPVAIAPGDRPGPRDQRRGQELDHHRQPQDVPGRRADRSHPPRQGRDRGQGRGHHSRLGEPPEHRSTSPADRPGAREPPGPSISVAAAARPAVAPAPGARPRPRRASAASAPAPRP